MRRAGVFCLLFCGLILLISACSDEAETIDQPNLYCANQEAFACEGDSLKICGVNGKWAYESCESLCVKQGLVYAGVCEFNEEAGRADCRCESDCCDEGAQRCQEDTLEICRSCEWSSVDCTGYCDRFSLPSLGCGVDPILQEPACLCEGAISTTCEPDYTKCREHYVDICGGDGNYSATSCRKRCEDLGFYFGYCETDEAQQQEICHCQETASDCSSTVPTCQGEAIAACINGNIEILVCSELCDDLGMTFAACERDQDRGHDVCRCEAVDEDGDTDTETETE
jgi:hypothetical protein